MAQFLLNVLSIPHSNSYIEQQFSQENIIKSEKRNLLLEVSTVSSLLQVKSYYSELNEKDHYFELSEKDFYFTTTISAQEMFKYRFVYLFSL